jgi:hypothetical protein
MKSVIVGILLCTIVLLCSAGCVDEDLPGPDTTPIPTASIIPTHVQPPVINASSLPTRQIPALNTTGSPVATPAEPASFHPLKLQQVFLFGNGTRWSSEIAVNRIWINDTYRWYNPEELQYDKRIAPAGKKYLLVFLSIINRGTERAPLPPHENIYVICDNAVIAPYALHPLPMKNMDSTPRIARIAEIEYFRKTYSSELVEDYGYSHGQKLGYVLPGESNAVEGYIIYEVPVSMIPEKTYATVTLPDKSESIWVLG